MIDIECPDCGEPDDIDAKGDGLFKCGSCGYYFEEDPAPEWPSESKRDFYGIDDDE